MTLVVDASVLVEALTNRAEGGLWARRVMQVDNVASAHYLPLEVARVLRRLELAGDISSDVAAIAHAELAVTRLELHAYHSHADRIWQLRHTLTVADAWYVALAEALDVPLATLDLRLTRAPGPRCRFVTPVAGP